MTQNYEREINLIQRAWFSLELDSPCEASLTSKLAR